MALMPDSTLPAPLSDMPERRPLRVAELKGASSLRAKLYAMGVLPGTALEICSRAGCDGSLCVRIRQSALIVDSSLARRIYCTLVDELDPALYGPDMPTQGDCACCGHFERHRAQGE